MFSILAITSFTNQYMFIKIQQNNPVQLDFGRNKIFKIRQQIQTIYLFGLSDYQFNHMIKCCNPHIT